MQQHGSKYLTHRTHPPQPWAVRLKGPNSTFSEHPSRFTFYHITNALKSYCKVRYLVEYLRHSAFILEFYIAFDVILICLNGDCFINKLKLGDPFKRYEIVPSIRLQCIFTHPSMLYV